MWWPIGVSSARPFWYGSTETYLVRNSISSGRRSIRTSSTTFS